MQRVEGLGLAAERRVSGQRFLAHVALDVVDAVGILRHVGHQTHEYVQRVVGLVVLCADVAEQISRVAGQGRRADVGSGRVGHGTFFADFVHHQSVETSGEVLVEGVAQHVIFLVVLAQWHEEPDLCLFGVGVGQEVYGILGDRGQGLVLRRGGRTLVGYQRQVLAEDVVSIVERHRAAVEDFGLVVGGAVDVAGQLGDGEFVDFLIGQFVDEARLILIDHVLHQGRRKGVHILLTLLACAQKRAFDTCQLLFVQLRHQDLARQQLAGLRQGCFVALHGDVQVVVAGAYAAGSVQLAQLFLQLLGLVGTHHAGIVHQLCGNAQLGELAFAHAVSQGEAEHVVFGIDRIVHLRAVVQLLDLHVGKVDELFLDMSDGHALELQGVERLLAYGRFDGLVAGLLDFSAVVGLAFFDVKGQVVAGQVLLGHALDVFGGDGHDFVLVAEHFAQVFFVDEGLHQYHGLVGVRLHGQVEVAAHVGLDGFDLPVFKFAVGNLLDGFQGFLLGTLVRLEAALVLVVQGDGIHHVASLLAAEVG